LPLRANFKIRIMTENLTISNWEESERPREKFLAKGAENLSIAELIAIVIRSGSKGENAVDLARKILNAADNNLSVLRKFTFEDYKKFGGMGQGKALAIMSMFEIAKRMAVEQAPPITQIYSSESAAKLMSPLLKDLGHEECWILYLNRGNRMIAKEKLTSGGTSSTVLDVKMIIKKAMAKLSNSIILVHNHPSGSKMPGDQDKLQTRRLKTAAEMCDISLLDHIIIAGDQYYSFADDGCL
jgi:DNA repair protein RadC